MITKLHKETGIDPWARTSRQSKDRRLASASSQQVTTIPWDKSVTLSRLRDRSTLRKRIHPSSISKSKVSLIWSLPQEYRSRDVTIHKHLLKENLNEMISREQDQEDTIEQVFARLVDQWRKETRSISSTSKMCLHPLYQQIIGLGEPAIPLLLRELEAKSGRWFWALQSISRENPVPPELRGKTKDMIESWLAWGKAKGFGW